MGEAGEQYNLAAIRGLLRDAFTAQDLWRFCQERPTFQPLLHRFGYNAGLDDMIDAVIAYSQTQVAVDELLSEIHAVNPRHYEHYQAVLYSTGPLPARQLAHNLPPRSEFVGRGQEKAGIHEALCSRSFLISIDGIGGIGKSSLALEVAYECLRAAQTHEQTGRVAAFDCFVWASAQGRVLDLGTLLDTIAQTLGYPGMTQRPPELKLSGVRQLLQEHPCLLIVDNFETVTDPGIAAFLLHLSEPSKALITTREQKLSQVWSISLRGLTEAESLDLIREEGKRLGLNSVRQADDRTLLRLYTATGGVPLALKWAIGQIKQRGQSLDTVLASLHEAKGSVFEDVFARSWELLSTEARQVLTVMPLFVAPASRAAIEAASDVHHYALDQALGQLAEMSLLDANDELEDARKRYAVHSLTRAFAGARLEEAERPGARQRIAQHFRSLAVQDVSGANKETPILSTDVPNIIQVVRWCFEYGWVDVGVETLRHGNSILNAGYWSELADLARQGAALADELNAAALRVWPIAWISRHRGNLEAAETEILDVLPTLERHGRLRHIARAKEQLGHIARLRGDLSKADGLFQASQQIYQGLGHTNDYWRVMILLAGVSLRQGDLDTTLERCNNALSYFDESRDPERVADAVGYLAAIAGARGDVEQELAYARQALALMRRAGRLDSIAVDLVWLARAEIKLGQTQAARAALLEALEIYRKLDVQNSVQETEQLIGALREGKAGA